MQPSYCQIGHGWYDFKYSDNLIIDNCPTETLPAYCEDEGLSSEVLQTIQDELRSLSPELRELSLDIWREYCSACNGRTPPSLRLLIQIIRR